MTGNSGPPERERPTGPRPPDPETPSVRELHAILAPYRSPETARSVWEIAVTATGFAATWVAAYLALGVGYWLTLLLAVPGALFVMRLFMIQHDCGHGAFFHSQRVADTVGSMIGVLTLVPYQYWRTTHAIHHKTAGDLDYRGFGDISTLTVREYRERSRLGRLGYRLYRHPFVLLCVGPVYQFFLKHRLPLDAPRAWKREWRSVVFSNLAMLAGALVAWQTVGIVPFLKVQLPISIIAGMLGVYLFYVQHQFEDTYWREHPEWEFHAAGLQGSSFFRLPKVLQWFTANIGFHHIHHVNARIPFYKLPRCFAEHPVLRHVTTLTLKQSLECLRLSLWDEDHRRLVSFREARQAA